MTDHGRYVLGNAVVFDGTTVLQNAAIRVSEGKIESVISADTLTRHEDESFYSLGGRLVLPGLLNAHHHLYSSLAPGIAPKGPTPAFTDILRQLWWPLDAAHTRETIYYSALAGLIAGIKHGVTTVFDHHASMSLVEGSLDEVARAFEQTGVKGTLCFEISERAGVEEASKQLDENLRFWDKHRHDSDLRGMLGLHANLTLSNKTLETVAKRRPEQMSIHVHAGEAPEDLEAARTAGFPGPLARLDHFGLVDGSSLIIHAIHLAEEDYSVIEHRTPLLVTNPESNANNGVGHLDTRRITRYLLGTDGMSSDVVAALRFHYLELKARGESCAHLTDCVLSGCRSAEERMFDRHAGIVPGASADIAVLDYVPLLPVTRENILEHLVFGAKSGRAYMTIAAGQILFRDGKLTFIDEDELRSRLKNAASTLYKRFYG